jgi:tetratricopeptide (TPR) repeat protein
MREVVRKRWLFVLMIAAAAGLRANLLEEGWAAYNQENYEQAYDLFSKAFRENPADVRANFALGEAAAKRGKYSHAVFAYDRVLMQEPAHQKARYGKARTLLALNQPEEARAEFAVLLEQDLNPNVRESIRKTVEQMDQAAKRWRLEGLVSLSLFYDNNVNFGPSGDVINTLNGTLTLNNASTKNDSWGVGLTAGGTAACDIGVRGGWYGIGGSTLYTTFMDDAPDQETFYGRVFGGVRRVERNALTELTVRYDRMDYGHDHLLDVYGADAAYLRALNRDNHLITRLGIEHRDFNTGISNNGRDSIYSAAKVGWRHYFTNRRNRTELTGEIFSDYANKEVNRNYGVLLKSAGELELYQDLIAYGSFQYRFATYEDNLTGTFAEAREDNQYTWSTGLRRPFANDWTVDVQHRYIRNDSNLGLYDYDRHLTSLTVTRKF